RIVVHFQPALYYRPGARAAVSKIRTSAALVSLARQLPRTEIVVHEADPPVRGRPDHALLRRAFRRARLRVHTESERLALEREYGVPAGRVRIVDHAEGVAVHPPASGAEARRLVAPDLPADEMLFLCAGFL